MTGSAMVDVIEAWGTLKNLSLKRRWMKSRAAGKFCAGGWVTLLNLLNTRLYVLLETGICITDGLNGCQSV